MICFYCFERQYFLLYWNTIQVSRAGLWRYLSNIKDTKGDQACSAATLTTTAGLLIIFDSLPWQQRVNHAPTVWQVNHKPTVWPNTQRKLSPCKRVNTFINAEVQWPLPIKTIMHSTHVSNQAGFSSSVTEAQVDPYNKKCRKWESTGQVLASPGKHLCARVNSTLQQRALVSRPKEKASPTLCLWSPLRSTLSVSALPIQDRNWKVF